MERSRRSVPVNAKFAALAQLKALKTGEAKRSDQFQVRRGDARLSPSSEGLGGSRHRPHHAQLHGCAHA